jgi:hypothetical protein
MIIEISFAIIGGLNLGLERSWELVKDLLEKYPNASWRKRINKRKKRGKYIVEIEG